MTATAAALILAVILLRSASQVGQKRAATVFGVVCYGLSLQAWLIALARIPRGRAYAALNLS